LFEPDESHDRDEGQFEGALAIGVDYGGGAPGDLPARILSDCRDVERFRSLREAGNDHQRHHG
jgi:hypothetical protein